NLPARNPLVSRVDINPAGLIGVGSTIRIEGSGVSVRLIVQEFAGPGRIAFTVKAGKTFGGSLVVLTPSETGTLVDHTLSLELRGAGKLFSLLIGPAVKKEAAALRKWVETH
ncbi:MAG TPA: hypothetical protein VIS74_08675, partial [Chthoniobacterales bacterium]